MLASILLSSCSRAKPPLSRTLSPELYPDAAATSPAGVATKVALNPTATLTHTPTATEPFLVTPTMTLSASATPTQTAESLLVTPTATEYGAVSTPYPTPMVTRLATPLATQFAMVVPTSTVTAALQVGTDLAYTIMPGDTLIGIAERFGSTPLAIQARNGIYDANSIYVGQQISVPIGYTPSETATPQVIEYTVQAGDSLSSLARRYHTSVDDILAENPGVVADPDHLEPGTVLRIPLYTATPVPLPPPPIYHYVRYSESLSGIARRYGVSVNTLVMANGLRNPNRVYVGQLLIIPR